jgi:hypothetical protein
LEPPANLVFSSGADITSEGGPNWFSPTCAYLRQQHREPSSNSSLVTGVNPKSKQALSLSTKSQDPQNLATASCHNDDPTPATTHQQSQPRPRPHTQSQGKFVTTSHSIHQAAELLNNQPTPIPPFWTVHSNVHPLTTCASLEYITPSTQDKAWFDTAHTSIHPDTGETVEYTKLRNSSQGNGEREPSSFVHLHYFIANITMKSKHPRIASKSIERKYNIVPTPSKSLDTSILLVVII